MSQVPTLQVVHEELTVLDVLDAETGAPVQVTVPSGRRWRGTFLVMPDARHELVSMELQASPDSPWEPRDVGQSAIAATAVEAA